jgi:heme-degrading monooxygenase HmoA
MHAVIFEVWPKEEGRREYLDIAAALLPTLKKMDGFISIERNPTLKKMDGFISIERFESLSEKGKILSLSFWRDDAAIAGWRQVERHRMAQSKGRGELFRDYRLRIAGVIRDYGMQDRAEVPPDSRERHG